MAAVYKHKRINVVKTFVVMDVYKRFLSYKAFLTFFPSVYYYFCGPQV